MRNENLKRVNAVQAALHCEHPRVWLFLLRTLSKGQPVSSASIADALAMSLPDVEMALGTFADAVYDDNGDVIACGLSLLPTPHAFKVCGKELYTWCALDALMYPVALDQTVHVESRCPVTQKQVCMTVSPTEVSDVSPAEVVLSMVTPGKESGCCNVRSSFCSGVHFISSSEAAATWMSQHPEVFILSVNEAWQLGYAVVQRRFSSGTVPF